MVLEVIEGPEKGRRVKLREGEVFSLGRTEIAMQRFAEDESMSALHCVLSLRAGILRMDNHSHTNTTRVNGKRVESAVLNSGDTVRAGNTIFNVIGPPPNPYLAQVRIGGWGFNIIPEGWQALDGVGLRHDGDSATGVEESLAPGKSLREYIAAQVEVAKANLKAVEFEGPAEARMEGAEEALLLKVTSETGDGARITQRQIYARSGEVVGILTLTGLPSVHQDFIEIVRGASFHKPQIPS